MGFGGFFFFLIIWAFLIGLVFSVFFVLLFMTGRRAPDPRGVLLPAAFSLSITLAGVFGALMTLATMSAAVGAEFAGLSSSCSASMETRFAGSSSRGAPLAQEYPPGPELELEPLPQIETPDLGDEPMFVPRPGVPLRPGDWPPTTTIRCDGEGGRRLLSASPWLLVSALAVGGGSRLFRTQLNEERFL